MSDLYNEIRAFFDEYARRWNSQDYKQLMALWDRSDPLPFYRPMEVEHPIKGWTDLEHYWAPPGGAPKIIEGLWNVYTNLVPKLIASDVCVVLWDMEWDIKPRWRNGQSGTDPGMSVLRRTPEGWRMVAYVEACMHPATYVRKLFERQVRPEFSEFIESKRDDQPRGNANDPAKKFWG
jgi:hypothetical protein